jgi:polysaccharide biosynthesis transport protein
MSFQLFLTVMRARRRIALAVLGLVVALTFAASLAIPKSYTAETQVFMDLLSQDLIGGAGAALSANSSASYIPTQVEVVNSSNVAQKVVEKLHLDRDPRLHAAWLRKTDGRGSEAVWIGSQLRRKLDVKPQMDSNILTISFSAPDPAMAAAVANAFAQAYIETNMELRNAPARTTAQWLSGQVDASRDALEQATKRVTDYQNEHAIVTSDERIDSETERLSLLSQQLVALQAQNEDAQSRLKVPGAASSAGNSLQGGVVSKLRSDIADLQARASEAAATLGTNHPTYLQMESRLDALRDQLASERRRLSGGIVADSAVGKLKEASLSAAIDAQKERLLGLKAQRAELDGLIKARETDQQALQDVTQKSSQAQLQAHSVQTNVSILAPAVAPLRPATPETLGYSLIGLTLGALFAIAAAFGCEIADRRVRSDHDAEDILGAPVLGRVAVRQKRTGALRRITAWSNG